jgi:hypothetical protein
MNQPQVLASSWEVACRGKHSRITNRTVLLAVFYVSDTRWKKSKRRRLYLYVTLHRQNLIVVISTQFAHCNNVSIGVPSLSNLHTSEPDGQNGATYKTDWESQTWSFFTYRSKVLQSKRENAKSFTTVRKLRPSHSYFRKTCTFLARIICRSFTPNFIKLDHGLRNVKVQIPLAPPPSGSKVWLSLRRFSRNSQSIDSFL